MRDFDAFEGEPRNNLNCSFTGVLEKWTSRKLRSEVCGSIHDPSLRQFRSGLISSALSQPLLSMSIDPTIKQFWASVRQQKQKIPVCHHYGSTCSCGSRFQSLQETWPCGHAKFAGETVAYENAQLYDIGSPPSPIATYLRICKSCGSLSRPMSLDSGLFTFDERHVLTVPLLLNFHHSLSFGTPLHCIVSSWAVSLEESFGCRIIPATINNIKAAFLAFEALCDHGQSEVCHLCKDNPAHLIFDGNAKLVFKLSGTRSVQAITVCALWGHADVSFFPFRDHFQTRDRLYIFRTLPTPKTQINFWRR